MLYLITDIKLEAEGLGWATVSMYWNVRTQKYHIETLGQWPESWADPQSDVAQDLSFAFGLYAGKILAFIEKGMIPDHHEWR